MRSGVTWSTSPPALWDLLRCEALEKKVKILKEKEKQEAQALATMVQKAEANLKLTTVSLVGDPLVWSILGILEYAVLWCGIYSVYLSIQTSGVVNTRYTRVYSPLVWYILSILEYTDFCISNMVAVLLSLMYSILMSEQNGTSGLFVFVASSSVRVYCSLVQCITVLSCVYPHMYMLIVHMCSTYVWYYDDFCLPDQDRAVLAESKVAKLRKEVQSLQVCVCVCFWCIPHASYACTAHPLAWSCLYLLMSDSVGQTTRSITRPTLRGYSPGGSRQGILWCSADHAIGRQGRVHAEVSLVHIEMCSLLS